MIAKKENITRYSYAALCYMDVYELLIVALLVLLFEDMTL